MKIQAISRISDNNDCEFFDENNNILFYTKSKVEDGIYKTCLFDKENNLLANISNKHSKVRAKNFIVKDVNNNFEYNIKLDQDYQIVDDELGLCLKRSSFNKKLELTIDDKIVMKAKCTTLIRQWLQGKYLIDIIDESKLTLIICTVIIAFIVISDEYVCTQKESF